MARSALPVNLLAWVRLAWLAVLCLFQHSTFADQAPYSVITNKRGLAVDVSIRNDGLFPINVVLELTSSINSGFWPPNLGEKYPVFLAPGQQKLVTTAVPLKRKTPGTFSYRSWFRYGDPTAMPDAAHVYRLPIADGHRAVIRPFSAHGAESITPENENAVELVVPLDTPVVAARDGVVMEAYGFEGQTDDGRPSSIGKYVLILHSDGSWGSYGWLKQGSLLVRAGDKVVAGQVIARSSSNPLGFDSFVQFSVMHNFTGTSVRSIPFKLRTEHLGILDPKIYSGPISADLPPLYKLPTAAESEWNPPQSLVPIPEVPHQGHGQGSNGSSSAGLSGAEGTAGVDPTVDTRLLVSLSATGVLVAVLGMAFSAVIRSHRRPAGVLGVVWSSVRGPIPVGPCPSPDVEPSQAVSGSGLAVTEPTAYRSSEAAAGVELCRPPAQAPTLPDFICVPTAPRAVATQPSPPPRAPASPQEAAVAADIVEPSIPATVMSRGRASLFSLLLSHCPAGTSCTASVPLSKLMGVDGDAVLDDAAVDFVLFDLESGEIKAAVLVCDDGSCDSADQVETVAVALSQAGIRSVKLRASAAGASLAAALAEVLCSSTRSV